MITGCQVVQFCGTCCPVKGVSTLAEIPEPSRQKSWDIVCYVTYLLGLCTTQLLKQQYVLPQPPIGYLLLQLFLFSLKYKK